MEITLETIANIILQLGSFGGVVAGIVNICKAFGWIKDGNSGLVVSGLNVLVFVVVAVHTWLSQVFGWSADWGAIDALFGQIGTLISVILSLVSLFTGSAVFHGLMSKAGVPLLGASFTTGRGFLTKKIATNSSSRG